MGTQVQLEVPGIGPIGGWLARPEGTPRGALVVVQEIFGVNAHIRAVTDRYAADGLLALAPALFDPVRPGAIKGQAVPEEIIASLSDPTGATTIEVDDSENSRD